MDRIDELEEKVKELERRLREVERQLREHGPLPHVPLRVIGRCLPTEGTPIIPEVEE